MKQDGLTLGRFAHAAFADRLTVVTSALLPEKTS
jgi:hypothetical protein